MANTAAQKKRRGDIAAQSIFAASAAINVIPIAGQFAAAGLAIAGALTKIFTGKKQAKREEAERKRQEILDRSQDAHAKLSQSGSGQGMAGPQGPQSVVPTVPTKKPETPAFSTYGGGQAPSVQPTQQALNNSIGIK